MAYKTIRGWRQARRPETQEAVKKFEQLSGEMVISARCHTTGSMRPYVSLLVKGSDALAQFAENYYNGSDFEEYPRKIGGVRVTYIHLPVNAQGYEGVKEHGLWVDIRWLDLGMTQPF